MLLPAELHAQARRIVARRRPKAVPDTLVSVAADAMESADAGVLVSTEDTAARSVA
jgi:hypothetical protein